VAELKRSAEEKMHTALAYLMFDGPGDPQFHLEVCVFIPVLSLGISWALSRSKMPAWILLVPAVIATLIVLGLISHGLTKAAMIREFGVEYVVAIIISAALPILAAFHFISLKKKEPIQSPQTTRAFGPRV
jgi:hypothetical protein